MPLSNDDIELNERLAAREVMKEPTKLLDAAFNDIFYNVDLEEMMGKELTFDNILAYAEGRLQIVYEAFGNAGEPFHGESPEFDDPLGRSVEYPD